MTLFASMRSDAVNLTPPLFISPLPDLSSPSRCFFDAAFGDYEPGVALQSARRVCCCGPADECELVLLDAPEVTTTASTAAPTTTTTTTTTTTAAVALPPSAPFFASNQNENCLDTCLRFGAPSPSNGADFVNTTDRLQFVLARVNETFSQVCEGAVTGSASAAAPLFGR